MKKVTLRFTLLSATATLLATAPAFADTLNLSLSTTTITLAPGGTYEFDGTISAPLTNTAVQALGDTGNVDSPLILDDTDFLYDAPLALAPGESYTGALFTITAPTGTATGTYAGFFDVIGNDDPTIVGSQKFTVDVANSTAVTPEPGSWLLLTTGLGAAGVLRRRFARA